MRVKLEWVIINGSIVQIMKIKIISTTINKSNCIKINCQFIIFIGIFVNNPNNIVNIVDIIKDIIYTIKFNSNIFFTILEIFWILLYPMCFNIKMSCSSSLKSSFITKIIINMKII